MKTCGCADDVRRESETKARPNGAPLCQSCEDLAVAFGEAVILLEVAHDAIQCLRRDNAHLVAMLEGASHATHARKEAN